jgi:hypothetical protein
MKIINFLIKFRLKKYDKIPLSSLINTMQQDIFKQEKIKDVDESFSNSLFENILIDVINTRCENLSVTSNVKITENRVDVKLFGDSNYIYDNSKWIELITNGKLKENLKLKEDLKFSESHLFYIINEHTKFYDLEGKNMNEIIISLIKKSEMKTIKDLRSLIDIIFYNKTINEKIYKY